MDVEDDGLRVMFTCIPAYGHLLPMLPLARAARDAGAQVAVATSLALKDVVAPLPLVPTGPPFPDIAAETYQRSPAAKVTTLDPTAFGELFGAVCVDMISPDALAAARTFRPDLVIADREDMTGPMVAGALGIPWARFLLGVDMPQEVSAAIAARAAERYAANGIRVHEPHAVLDPWPQVLQPPGWQPVAGRIAVRPEPHSGEESDPAVRRTRRAAGSAARPRVLLTTGTIADDEHAVATAVDSLLGADVDVLLTGRHGEPWPLDLDPDRVRQVGFAPLAELLEDVDAAVVAGGSGTLVGALARGVPLVVLPLVFDQPGNAERAAATGAAMVAAGPDRVGAAARRVLDDPAFAAAATDVAAQIAAMDSPQQAWRRLLASVEARPS